MRILTPERLRFPATHAGPARADATRAARMAGRAGERTPCGPIGSEARRPPIAAVNEVDAGCPERDRWVNAGRDGTHRGGFGGFRGPNSVVEGRTWPLIGQERENRERRV